MQRKTTTFAAITLLGALWAATGQAEDPSDHPMIGSPAPPFELESVNGHPPLSLGELRGGYVVVHFAASW